MLRYLINQNLAALDKVKLLILLTGVVSCLKSFSQVSQATIENYLSQEKYQNASSIRIFYESIQFEPAWIRPCNQKNVRALLNAIEASPYNGLHIEDYDIGIIQNFNNGLVALPHTTDSINLEIRITNAAIRFYSDICYGNATPELSYNGLAYSTDVSDIPPILACFIKADSLTYLESSLTSHVDEIILLKEEIKKLYKIYSQNNFKEILITSAKVELTNSNLLTKLCQLGMIESINTPLARDSLIKIVKETQRQFNLLSDGELRPTALEQLNIPIDVRLKQLNLSINYYRWLYGLVKSRHVILVNIPAAFMRVYFDCKPVLEMRMTLGKASTPTPTLLSCVNEAVLYPYWHVPKNIATKELLPFIKQDPGFIDANDYQVLDLTGKILDPYAINWKALSSSKFPYIIRQSTGCDNALGLLKIDFSSPFGVYLHDTPYKIAFTLNKRFLSHGCLRMEKPMELGRLILKNHPLAIDSLEQKGCLRNQSPTYILADDRMVVLVWYNPIGIDAAGGIVYFDDPYKKFLWKKQGKN